MGEPNIIDTAALAADVAEFSARDHSAEMDAALAPGAPPAELPPVPDGSPTIVLGVRLPLDTYLEIAKLAEARGVKPGTLARQWLQERLAAEFIPGRRDARLLSRAELLAAIKQLPDAA